MRLERLSAALETGYQFFIGRREAGPSFMRPHVQGDRRYAALLRSVQFASERGLPPGSALFYALRE